MHFQGSVFCAALLAGSACADGFDLKGIRLGEPATRAQIRKATGLTCDGYCSGLMQVAGQWLEVTFERDAHNRVSEIHSFFENDAFEPIDDALTRKYGPPQHVGTSAVVSGFGGHFTRIDHIWEKDGATIQIEKYTTATQAGLMMRSSAKSKEEAQKAAKAKKDI